MTATSPARSATSRPRACSSTTRRTAAASRAPAGAPPRAAGSSDRPRGAAASPCSRCWHCWQRSAPECLIGRATKDDDKNKASTTPQSTDVTVRGQTNLRPPSGAPDKNAVGIAQFVERKPEGDGDPEKLLNVIAQGLPRAPEGSGYGVWLTKAGVDPVWLGYFQAVTSTGEVGAQSPLRVDPTGYDRVILTRQRGQEPKTPGTVYLAGDVKITSPSG